MTELPKSLIDLPIPAESVPGPEGTDVLSDVLSVFRASGASLLRGDFHEPWSWVAHPSSAIATLLHPGATRVVIFHVVAEGTCWVEIEGEPRRFLREGDVVGFPHGHAHKMGAGVSMQCVPIESLFPPRPWTALPVLRSGENGKRTRIVCVYLRCDDVVFNPLLESLPALLVGRRGRNGAAQWMNSNLRYLIAEANQGSAGGAWLLARMTEILFIEMVRNHIAELGEQDIGWLAALKDRHVARVLHLFHSDPSRPWKSTMLGKEAGLSRSRLDERFRQLLGTSPSQYLARWRLQLAAQALRNTQESIVRIANRVGYGSEEAFSRAFKRFTGSSPALWRRQQHTVVQSSDHRVVGMPEND